MTHRSKQTHPKSSFSRRVTFFSLLGFFIFGFSLCVSFFLLQQQQQQTYQAAFAQQSSQQTTAAQIANPPPGCFYQHRMCPMIMCASNNCPPCGNILICPTNVPPSITPIPHRNCIPEPTCLQHPPYCYIPVPVGGWCPPSSTPIPTSISPTPTCVPIRPPCLPGRLCPNYIICGHPTITPALSPTCIPEPWCVHHAPFCYIQAPVKGWCPPSSPPIITPPQTICTPQGSGSCWFGQGCPQGTTCKGFIAGKCFPQSCQNPPSPATSVSTGTVTPQVKCSTPKILGVNVPRIAWFVMGSNCTP